MASSVDNSVDSSNNSGFVSIKFNIFFFLISTLIIKRLKCSVSKFVFFQNISKFSEETLAVTLF